MLAQSQRQEYLQRITLELTRIGAHVAMPVKTTPPPPTEEGVTTPPALPPVVPLDRETRALGIRARSAPTRSEMLYKRRRDAERDSREAAEREAFLAASAVKAERATLLPPLEPVVQ